MLIYDCVRRTALVCLVTSVATAPALAEGLSLQQALDMATRCNPSIAAGGLSADSARQLAKGARALTNPDILVAPSVVGNGGSDSAAIIVQPLEINGSRKARAAIASHEAAAAGSDAEALKRSVLLQVAASYWDVAQARELVKLNQENVSYLDTVRAAVEKQRDVGAAPGQQLVKMEVELARARQELAQAELGLSQSKAALNTLLNRPCGTEFETSDPLVFREAPVDRSSLRALALAHRPEVAAAQSQFLAAKGQVSAVRLKTVPDVALEARRETFDPGSESGIAIAISLPLLDWGSARASRRAAAKAAQSREKQLEAARNQVLLDIEQAAQQVDAAARIVREYQSGMLDKSERLAAMAKKGYEKGASNYLEMLEAQRTLRSTKTAYYSALAEHAKARAQLEWATGCPIEAVAGTEVKR
jgi:cobalt-zinc-cadmium efflux system outer membrane protein